MSKLVRDNIPEVIKKQGGECAWHPARPDEYWAALLAKLKEETDEFLQSKNEAELVDVIEVVDAIIAVMDRERVQWMRDEKAKAKGRFEKRIILDD